MTDRGLRAGWPDEMDCRLAQRIEVLGSYLFGHGAVVEDDAPDKDIQAQRNLGQQWAQDQSHAHQLAAIGVTLEFTGKGLGGGKQPETLHVR